MVRDQFGHEVTADDILAGFQSDLESAFWPTLTDDTSLDDDQRAEVTRKIEEAEEAIKEARKIIGVSSENDT
jgi:hypothetical protein